VFSDLWRDRADKNAGRYEAPFIAIALACLWAWRWPFLLESREFNPDESQLIAGAITLTQDPVFWRSVDGTTSGPLNFYALLPLHALGLPLDYFMARLTGLILISITLIACHRLLRSFLSAAPAQLALLPLLFFFATTTDPFFLEYSSGDVSMALFALSACFLFRHGASIGEKKSTLLFGAFLCGVLPWAKLQTVPLAATLIGGSLWLIVKDPLQPWRRRAQLGAALLLAAIIPSVLALLVVIITGQFEPFVQGYLRQNFVYIDNSASIAHALTGMWKFTSKTCAFPAFLVASSVIMTVTLCIHVRLRQHFGRLFWPATVSVLAAVVCVVVPRRPYAHYLLLTLVPLTLWTGAVLEGLWPAVRYRLSLGLVLLTIGGLGPLLIRFRQARPVQLGNLTDNWRHPYSLPGTLLRSCRVAGDSLGVWGWRTDLYVDARMPQATRDPHTFWSLVGSPYQTYYQNRFVADLKRSRPAFFVDTVGRGAVFYQDRRAFGHEIVPALAEYIERDYVLLADLQSERVYLRADLRHDSRRDFGRAALKRILSKAREDTIDEVDAPQPASITPSTLGTWNLDGQPVRMLLPPAKMTWALDGTELEASVSFGFHPRAYLEGKSNGADIILELELDGSPPQILFQRFLDPARLPEDRRMLSARVALPANTKGARLVIRTEPGKYGDQAWDWVYLASLRYIRAIERQYPGFASAEPSTGSD